MSSPSKSSDSPAAAAAASPSKPSSNNASVPTSFKNKIAAFESGLAANASKVDQSKQIPHADLSNLRSRFDKEGEKPLQVKGSFGLGAAPPKHLLNPSGNATSGGRGDGGQRAVSLGIGRAVSPIQSPTVVLPGPSPTGILGRSVSSSAGAGGPPSTSTSTSSASASSRPLAARSDSTNSNSTSATSTTSISGNTATSTASSLLPGPLAALRGSSSGGGGGIGSPNSPYGGIGGGSRGSEDDSMSAGLRTPMSSISLSSMQVEAGSTIGDAASSSGDTTANEDEGVTADSDKADKQARTILAPELVTTPTDVTGLTNARTEGLELSAAALEKRKEELEEGGEAQQGGNRRGGDNDDSQMEGAIRPPQDAVERAAEELDKYTHEEPSQTAVMSPPLQSSSSMSQLTVPGTEDVDDETTSSNNNDNNTGNKLPSPPSSAKKSPSRPLSMTSGPRERLKRSSTANSIASAASHPESDLADTNLENFDAQAATGSDDVDKAQNTAESMVPTNSSNPSDAPTVPAVITSPGDDDDDDIVTEEDIAFAQDKQEFAPINEGEATEELDEEGMPLVKCSDCGSKVSLVKLGEHACSAITPSASRIAFPSTGDSTKEDQEKASLNGLEQYARDRRETGPEDVPTDDLSPEPMPSPQMSHRSVTSSRPDVPDDASVSSLSAGLEDMSLNENSSYKKTQLPQDEDEIETADLVSREEGSSGAVEPAEYWSSRSKIYRS